MMIDVSCSGKLMRLWRRETRRLRILRECSEALQKAHAARLTTAAISTWRWRYDLKKMHHTAMIKAASAMMYRFRRRAFSSLRENVQLRKEVRSLADGYELFDRFQSSVILPFPPTPPPPPSRPALPGARPVRRLVMLSLIGRIPFSPGVGTSGGKPSLDGTRRSRRWPRLWLGGTTGERTAPPILTWNPLFKGEVI